MLELKCVGDSMFGFNQRTFGIMFSRPRLAALKQKRSAIVDTPLCCDSAGIQPQTFQDFFSTKSFRSFIVKQK